MDLIISTSTAKAVAKSVTVKGAELAPAQRQEIVTTLMKYVGKVPAFTFTKGKTKTQVNAKYGKTNVALELGSVVYSPKGKIEKIGLRLGTTQKYLVIGLVAETKLKLNALANIWFKGVAGFTKLPTAPKAKPAVDTAPAKPAGKKVDTAPTRKPRTPKAETAVVAKPDNKPRTKKEAPVVAPTAKAPRTPKAVTKEPAARANQATKVTPKAAPKDKQPHAHKQGKEIKVKVTPLKSQSGKKHKVAI